MAKKKYILFAIILIGLLLRLLYFKEITFGWDQARDAIASMDIWTGNHLKIIGPGTDIPGLYHGTFYWYLISPFYFFSHGNVYVVRLFLILLSLVNIPLIYYISYKIFYNKVVSLLSSFFIAISFEATEYGRWISNVNTAFITVPISFYGALLLLQKKGQGLPILLIAWALSIHSQFLLVYQLVIFVPILIYALVKKVKFSIKDKLLSVLSLAIISPFIVAEVKFKFTGIKALLAYLAQKQPSHEYYLPKFIRSIENLTHVIQNNFINQPTIAYILLLFIFISTIFLFLKKAKERYLMLFLFGWFISPMIIFSLEKTNAYFIDIGNTYPLLILGAYWINKISELQKKIKYIILTAILCVVFISNLLLITQHNSSGEYLFSVQKSNTLSDQKAVLKYIYEDSHGKPFNINTVTNPLFINTTWAFLFQYYGNQFYHYMPGYNGYPQDGQFGSNIVFGDSSLKENKLFYLIFEPPAGIPKEYVTAYEMFENTRTHLIARKKIGNFTVEKRIVFFDKAFSRDEVFGYTSKTR